MPKDYVKDTIGVLGRVGYEMTQLRPYEYLVVGCYPSSRLFFQKQSLLLKESGVHNLSVAERLESYGWQVELEDLDGQGE